MTTRTHRPTAGPPRAAPQLRPVVTELRLAAFGPHRRTVIPLAPLTVLTGPSGSGKSVALKAYEALARLGAGLPLDEVFPDPSGNIPERGAPDAEGRRGFRIGCTVDGPAGPVCLDLAVQAEPTLRIVGERLTGGGETLLSTALRDPRRPTVQAAWHTAGHVPVTRAPFPDDRLGTALLPLRVAGTTTGQLQVLAAAEQVVVGLHSAFVCDPQPAWMRGPALLGDDLLRGGCDNIAAVLGRTRARHAVRHARLVSVASAGFAEPVTALSPEDAGDGTVHASVGRNDGRSGRLGLLGDGELRYLALALALLHGPAVLEVDTPAEVPEAVRVLTVLADGLDRGLDGRQADELLRLASTVCGDGHTRLLAAVGAEAGEAARTVPGAAVVDL
ncbi:ATP-binding protein [uncultured Streptomyces sp.]|uniref:ATP-binding protein n=1 Tax=uncultured Streptomyces sp. TaxID=174707 RepID=UPI00261E4688|nr:ATP-binding protein [uncultured Streptomyces sp.]